MSGKACGTQLGGVRMWSAARIAQLKALLSGPAKLSASQIAAALGGDVTRSAVIGKVNRLKLSLPNKGDRSPLNGVRRVRRKRLSGAIAQAPNTPAHRLRPAVIEPKHLTLIELEPHHCRWPYGDGPFTFCGSTHMEDSAYCAGHHALSLAPPEEVAAMEAAATIEDPPAAPASEAA